MNPNVPRPLLVNLRAFVSAALPCELKGVADPVLWRGSEGSVAESKKSRRSNGAAGDGDVTSGVPGAIELKLGNIAPRYKPRESQGGTQGNIQDTETKFDASHGLASAIGIQYG